MINNRLFLLILCTTAFISGNDCLVVVIMVKNERGAIKETLQPFVDAGIKQFLLYDTGSEDDTVLVTKEFFDSYNLKTAYIIEDTFIDFSTSRNRALDAAERLFPQATFLLMPDAEWYMYNVPFFLEFCESHINDCHDSYAIRAQYNTTINTFLVTRLIRCRKNVRFVGPVHECLNRITYATVPHECYFEWRPRQEGLKKSTQRWYRDRDLLLKSYEEDPLDPRTLFYLGQTYYCLGDLRNAYMFYEKRTKIRGWDEENFLARFRLGDVALDIATQYDEWFYPVALNHYLEAFNMRPIRAEPLIKIAEYYISHDKMALAFLFANQACKIPYPAHEFLVVEKHLYNFTRYEILSRCAWYVQEYEIGEWAAEIVLKNYPEMPHLHQNMQCYKNRPKTINCC
jgi:tetratricopeptide (TPR) repeat protein